MAAAGESGEMPLGGVGGERKFNPKICSTARHQRGANLSRVGGRKGLWLFFFFFWVALRGKTFFNFVSLWTESVLLPWVIEHSQNNYRCVKTSWITLRTSDWINWHTRSDECACQWRRVARVKLLTVWCLGVSVRQMVECPYDTRSDSFYFVDNRLVMHNKADYAYNGGQWCRPASIASTCAQTHARVHANATLISQL